MIETQVLMTVSNFSGFFLGIISWKRASLFNRGGVFQTWDTPWEASILMGNLESTYLLMFQKHIQQWFAEYACYLAKTGKMSHGFTP